MFDADLARVLDELTVLRLEETTPRDLLARARRDERAGVDPYDDEPRGSRYRDPRSELRVCAAPDCAAAFWTEPSKGSHQIWCSVRCRCRQYRPALRRRYPVLDVAS